MTTPRSVQRCHLFVLPSLDLLPLDFGKGRKLDGGQAEGRDAVKVDKRKIQSSTRDTELLMGGYTEALSLD